MTARYEKIIRGGISSGTAIGMYILTGLLMQQSDSPEDLARLRAAEISACADALEPEESTSTEFPVGCEPLQSELTYTKIVTKVHKSGESSESTLYVLPPSSVVNDIENSAEQYQKDYERDMQSKNVVRPILSLILGGGIYKLSGNFMKRFNNAP